MRRHVVVLTIGAVLSSACGASDLPPAAAEGLQQRVALIRRAAEAGRPGLASGRLERLIEAVRTLLRRGVVDEGRVVEILEAAEAVMAELEVLPSSPSPSPSSPPSPSPDEEDDGEGEGEGEGNGKGKGKENGEGKSDEGHGNDD